MSQDEVGDDIAVALQRLSRRRGGQVPFVQQLEASDCGAASLAMVLAYHGSSIKLDELRTATGVNRGTDAISIIRGAERYGLSGRAVQLDVADLDYLPRASILHWNFNHFVVLDRARGKTVDIVDPAFGRRRLKLETFSKHFTGVAMVFEPTEEFTATPPGRSKLWSYLRNLFSYPAVVTRILVTSLTLRLLALGLPILTAMVVDRVIPRGDFDLLTIIGWGLGVVLAFHFLSDLLRAYLLLELRTKLDTKMTFGFVSHLLSLPYAFFNRRSSGDLLMRVQSNVQIREMLTSSALSSLLDGGLALAYLTLLLFLSPILGAITALVAGLQVVVLLLARRRYAQLTSEDLETQARSQSYLLQMLVGVETLKIAGAENRAMEHWGNLFIDQLNVSLKRSRLQAIVQAVNGLLHIAAPLVLLTCGAHLVLQQGLSLGTMLAANALAVGFLTPLRSMVDSALQLQMLGSYVERIDDVLATEPEQVRDNTVTPSRLTGGIELHRVSFRYGPNDPLVVREVNLDIAPGSTVAIVGRSGSGKSTLAALMVGLHRPTDGRIVYDGYDLNELDHRLLRQQLGVVPQAPFIFSGSVRDNIALNSPNISFDRIVAAARRAGIDDDIRQMAMGYETVVADGGATLSGGQRQRLALARALVHDPAVLLLDEATSALDSTTERKVMDNLRGLRSTQILVAHRLSTIANADVIVVMQDGRMVESGTHRDLIRRNGAYKALVNDQTFSSEAAA